MQTSIFGLVVHVLNIERHSARCRCSYSQDQRMFTSGNGDRSNAPNFIILLTDGESNVRADDTVPRAIDARISGATIITVGIGSDVNMLELRGE